MKLKHLAAIHAGHPFRTKIPEVLGAGVIAVQMKNVSPKEGINWSGCIETELVARSSPG